MNPSASWEPDEMAFRVSAIVAGDIMALPEVDTGASEGAIDGPASDEGMSAVI